ncbi:uncharacterized protein LOC118750755 [Rhagoletis pomonella]|uniref:uncharacterized protein LOC118750755 n=1 Tax=Rhagoletis pomonella TaxID=28610 RepID=UPI00177E0D6E|nr:uncharacterized protein LOC118750755 [Rhagoletis pomonella]
MGHLPARRVAVTRPFYSTGVDFCGPILTTVRLRGARTVKSYLAIMVCFSTKAVHIEVVSDLSTKAFMAALKRFVARRGLCHHLYCDNGTNFVGARREMQEWKQMFFSQQQQHKISEFCAVKGIAWHHIPPRSPHFGGLWEAAVKSAKYHLTRTLGDAHFTFEELCTITTEIEAILNSRPLCTGSADPNDEEVLTPAHFLVGSTPDVLAEPLLEPAKVSLRDQWQRLTVMKQHFWARWSKEYLQDMQRKAKWIKPQRNLAVGDLVLVAEDNAPPKHWMMGRVERVVPDEAGAVRVAEVRTKNGCIKRAIQKLARIPTEDEING